MHRNKIETNLDSRSKPQLESFLRQVARAPRSLLMLDFDGTLAPFQRDRRKALPYPGIRSVLQEIIDIGNTRVVIVSGRDVTETVPLLAVKPHPEVWGLHGLQRLKADGSIELCELDESTLNALTAAEDWLRSQNLQHTVELKTGSIAVHWRGLEESEAQAIREHVMLGWTAIAEHFGLDLMDFDGGIEIRSRKANKGTAVRTLLSEMDPGVPAAYLGDDTTDEDAFLAMTGRGLSILVRSEWRPTAAQIWLKPPNELLELLAGWLHTCLEWDHNQSNRSQPNHGKNPAVTA
jgi:trehalose 6-phosphate phosphatase